ncbi:MAG: DUF362 domain-containing protein [Candidatus Hermodarchaeota archaeon]
MNINSSKAEASQVALIRSTTPKDAVLEGISKLGGISKFVKEGDLIFIKINLRNPSGFPTNTNFDVLSSVISLCIDAGAKEIYVGSFPDKHIKIHALADALDLQSIFKKFRAKLLLLDDEEKYSQEIINQKNEEFEIASAILRCDKMISINQVNVDPIFTCTLSLLNSYSIVSNEAQQIKKQLRVGKDYLHLDQYKKDLISNILAVFMIKKPNLVINDLFYVLEGAGPFIYKDSNLKKTGFMVIGNDAVAVDSITLELLNFDINNNDLLIEARDKKVGIVDLSDIKLIGEDIDKNKLDITFCASKLEDIEVNNTDIKKGRSCSGCYNQAYHLLNLMKSNMTKDLKYIKRQSLLIGEKPQEPESLENLLIFGDCAINSTKDRAFRTITIEKGKNLIEKAKNKIKKEKKKKSISKTKTISNKQILELPGCPPDILKCIFSIIKYYGKEEVPGLNLYYNLISTYVDSKKVEALKK